MPWCIVCCRCNKMAFVRAVLVRSWEKVGETVCPSAEDIVCDVFKSISRDPSNTESWLRLFMPLNAALQVRSLEAALHGVRHFCLCEHVLGGGCLVTSWDNGMILWLLEKRSFNITELPSLSHTKTPYGFQC